MPDGAAMVDARGDGGDERGEPDRESGADTTPADGDAAGSSEASPDQMEGGRAALCVRLYDPMKPNYVNTLSEQVEGDFFNRVYKDCDVAKLVQAETDTIFMFANDLLFFSLDLWGCSKRPVTGFGLGRPEFPDMTSADVARLIDHYMAAATKILRLDDTEAAFMRADLTALGKGAVSRQSNEFALSMCGLDGGDAGADAAEAAPIEASADAGGGS
jgi:hypothetical protein